MLFSDTRGFLLSAAACAVVLALSGCGGGGGGAMRDTMQPSGPTTPVRVNVVGVSSIHLEMTDPYDAVKRPTGASVPSAPDLIASDYRRSEVVCPGLAHNGNRCTVSSIEVDGRSYDFPEDLSIEVHAAIFNSIEHWYPDPINGVRMFGGETTGGTLRGTLLSGGFGKYSAFYALYLNDPRTDRTWGAAFGDLYDGRPNADQGGMTWRGAMVGRTRTGGVEVEGHSLLEYEFSSDTLDLTLSNIAAPRSGDVYTGPASFVWSDLQQNSDGSFYIPGHGNDKAGTPLHPTLGYVDGDFYGPNAEEFAGVFEREGVVGAFGGHRQ